MQNTYTVASKPSGMALAVNSFQCNRMHM